MNKILLLNFLFLSQLSLANPADPRSVVDLVVPESTTSTTVHRVASGLGCMALNIQTDSILYSYSIRGLMSKVKIEFSQAYEDDHPMPDYRTKIISQLPAQAYVAFNFPNLVYPTAFVRISTLNGQPLKSLIYDTLLDSKAKVTLGFYEECPVQSKTTSVSLDGRYDLHMDLNGRHYTDQLTIKAQQGSINMGVFGGPIVGSLAVTNSFTSELSGNAVCSMGGSYCDLNFDIIANEGSQDFKVHYQAQVTTEDYLKIIDGTILPTLRGTAVFENGEQADFVAVMKLE